MTEWKLKCPNCGTINTIPAEDIIIECGKVRSSCNCLNCQHQFESEEEYWRWLDLDKEPLPELEED